MKSAIFSVVATSLLAAPCIASAQTNCTLTRAQVKAELIALEEAGFSPVAQNDIFYPDNFQAALARSASARSGLTPAASCRDRPSQ